MKSQTDFYLSQLHSLLDGTITALARTGVPQSPDEQELFGFVVTLANGKKRTLLLLCDDEGNGPGSFELINDD